MNDFRAMIIQLNLLQRNPRSMYYYSDYHVMAIEMNWSDDAYLPRRLQPFRFDSKMSLQTVAKMKMIQLLPLLLSQPLRD